MEENDIKSTQTCELENGLFKVITSVRMKIKKSEKTKFGHKITSFEDKDSYYEKEVINEERLEPKEFMKMVTNIRGKRDSLRSQKDMYDEYTKAVERFDSYVKEARKLIDKQKVK